MNADLVFSGNFLVENFYLNTFSFLDFDDLKIVHFFLASKLSLLENLYQTKTYIDDVGERYVKWNVFSSSDFLLLQNDWIFPKSQSSRTLPPSGNDNSSFFLFFSQKAIVIIHRTYLTKPLWKEEQLFQQWWFRRTFWVL